MGGGGQGNKCSLPKNLGPTGHLGSHLPVEIIGGGFLFLFLFFINDI